MIRGEAKATLKDGRTLTLAMGFRALALASAETRIPASEIFKVLQKDDGRQTLALFALIEASLSKYHKDIGQDEVDDLMLTDSEVLSEAVSKALNGAFNDDTEETEKIESSEGNGVNGTGTSSKKPGRKQV
jgi:hypothetical protein